MRKQNRAKIVVYQIRNVWQLVKLLRYVTFTKKRKAQCFFNFYGPVEKLLTLTTVELLRGQQTEERGKTREPLSVSTHNGNVNKKSSDKAPYSQVPMIHTGPIIRTVLISGGLYCSFSLLYYSSYYTYCSTLKLLNGSRFRSRRYYPYCHESVTEFQLRPRPQNC